MFDRDTRLQDLQYTGGNLYHWLYDMLDLLDLKRATVKEEEDMDVYIEVYRYCDYICIWFIMLLQCDDRGDINLNQEIMWADVDDVGRLEELCISLDGRGIHKPEYRLKCFRWAIFKGFNRLVFPIDSFQSFSLRNLQKLAKETRYIFDFDEILSKAYKFNKILSGFQSSAVVWLLCILHHKDINFDRHDKIMWFFCTHHDDSKGLEYFCRYHDEEEYYNHKQVVAIAA